jgi:hypothetical protein
MTPLSERTTPSRSVGKDFGRASVGLGLSTLSEQHKFNQLDSL